MELNDKLKPAADKLRPLPEKLKPLLKKLKAEGLKGYAIRSSAIHLVCLAAAVLLCHSLLSKGMTVAALCVMVIAGGLMVHANIMFAMDMKEPLDELTVLCRYIAEGRYGLQSPKAGDDEIGDLTDAINHLSAKISEYEKTQAEFISSVSHELRTPLTAITGWSETMLFDENITGDSRRGLEIIGREAGRLTNMVNDLLEFTRIQDGRFKLTMGTVDVIAELEDAMMAYSDLLRKENMQMAYHVPDADIPFINGDSERLRQVFLNILDNAAKYGRGGTVDIGIKENGTHVFIMFRDHGPGIPENEIAHVKERFFKGSTHVRGNGIGLAVCEEIVTRHGGELLINNADGGGLIVTVKLPVGEPIL